MGHTSTTKWITLLVVSLQLIIAIHFGNLSESGQQSAWNWRFFITAYVIGGYVVQINPFTSLPFLSHSFLSRLSLNFPRLRLISS